MFPVSLLLFMASHMVFAWPTSDAVWIVASVLLSLLLERALLLAKLETVLSVATGLFLAALLLSEPIWQSLIELGGAAALVLGLILISSGLLYVLMSPAIILLKLFRR